MENCIFYRNSYFLYENCVFVKVFYRFKISHFNFHVRYDIVCALCLFFGRGRSGVGRQPAHGMRFFTWGGVRWADLSSADRSENPPENHRKSAGFLGGPRASELPVGAPPRVPCPNSRCFGKFDH